MNSEQQETEAFEAILAVAADKLRGDSSAAAGLARMRAIDLLSALTPASALRAAVLAAELSVVAGNVPRRRVDDECLAELIDIMRQGRRSLADGQEIKNRHLGAV